MKPWDERQPDHARLFNPAYVGVLVHDIIEGYAAKRGGRCPLPLVFPAMTFVLHPGVRDALPKSSAKRMASWLRERPELRGEILVATEGLVPTVREGMILAVRCGWLGADGHGLLPGSKPGSTKAAGGLGDDRKAAGWIGGWFAAAGDAKDVFLILGATP